jgi:hypothetical protein
MKTRKRIEELEAQIDFLGKRVDKLRDDMYDDDDMFLSRVSYALQKVLETEQTITIKHYVEGKEVTTKLMRDEWAKLHQEETELSIVLDNIRELKEKYDNR